MATRTRFAPSPTGYLHIGGVRTALFCWLFARNQGGQFLLRIEDTDRQRSSAESVDIILEAMTWLGLAADEDPVYQTDRLPRYLQVADQLLAAGSAYRCYCTPAELEARRQEQQATGIKPRYDGRCRDRQSAPDGVASVVRFRTPDAGKVVVSDELHGQVEFDNGELDDLILIRSDGTPTYNFSVVVDDADMEITHVIRGDDHLNNTPRQIHIFNALGWSVPRYVHVPMILGNDGARLSKRHGSVNVLHYRDEGYLPEALLNYLVRLGWSHGDQEIFSVDELIRSFDLKALNRSAAAFDPEKLLWLNQHYIVQADVERLAGMLAEQLQRLGIDQALGPPLADIVSCYRERAQTMAEMALKSVYLFADTAEYEPAAARKHLQARTAPVLEQVRDRLGSLDEWAASAIESAIRELAADMDLGLGKVAQPIRVAATGDVASPGIGDTLALLGRAKTLQRLESALRFVADQ